MDPKIALLSGALASNNSHTELRPHAASVFVPFTEHKTILNISAVNFPQLASQ